MLYKLIVGGDGGINFFNIAEEVDKMSRLEQAAFAFDAPAKKGGAGTLLPHPDTMKEIGSERKFQIGIAGPWPVKNLERRLATVNQDLGVRLAKENTDHQIAVGKGRDLLRFGA